MVEMCRWKDSTFRQAEIRREISGVGFVEEDGMSDRIGAVLVDPRVQGGVVVVSDLVPVLLLDESVETFGIGATPVKSVSWVEGGLEVPMG